MYQGIQRRTPKRGGELFRSSGHRLFFRKCPWETGKDGEGGSYRFHLRPVHSLPHLHRGCDKSLCRMLEPPDRWLVWNLACVCLPNRRQRSNRESREHSPSPSIVFPPSLSGVQHSSRHPLPKGLFLLTLGLLSSG